MSPSGVPRVLIWSIASPQKTCGAKYVLLSVVSLPFRCMFPIDWSALSHGVTASKPCYEPVPEGFVAGATVRGQAGGSNSTQRISIQPRRNDAIRSTQNAILRGRLAPRTPVSAQLGGVTRLSGAAPIKSGD